jgi:hypothetical protein
MQGGDVVSTTDRTFYPSLFSSQAPQLVQFVFVLYISEEGWYGVN